MSKFVHLKFVHRREHLTSGKMWTRKKQPTLDNNKAKLSFSRRQEPR